MLCRRTSLLIHPVGHSLPPLTPTPLPPPRPAPSLPPSNLEWLCRNNTKPGKCFPRGTVRCLPLCFLEGSLTGLLSVSCPWASRGRAAHPRSLPGSDSPPARPGCLPADRPGLIRAPGAPLGLGTRGSHPLPHRRTVGTQQSGAGFFHPEPGSREPGWGGSLWEPPRGRRGDRTASSRGFRDRRLPWQGQGCSL